MVWSIGGWGEQEIGEGRAESGGVGEWGGAEQVSVMASASAGNTFLYLASAPGGGYRVGRVQGKDERQAAFALRRQRLSPITTIALPAALGGVDMRKAIPLKDQAELHLQLSQLTGRGVPLVEALDVIAQSVGPLTRAKVESCREQVASGASFATAVQKAGLVDTVTQAVYAAAERTGDLAGAAKQVAVTVRRQLAIREKILTLAMYPVMVLTVTIPACLFLLVYIVPRVGKTLQDQLGSGMTLPWYTRAIMGTGIFLREQWIAVLIALAAAGVMAYVFRGPLRRGLGALLRRTPVAREVVTAAESARFFTVMAAMTRSGIPLADALAVADRVVSHPVLKDQLRQLRTRLVEGGVLRQLIDGVTALPIASRRFLLAAERSGDLEVAFSTLAQDMTEELERRTTRLLAVLEPALIIALAVLVGGMLLSIMIPMLNATSRFVG